MDLSINSNQTSISPLEQLRKRQDEQNERFASGLRINSAADDAAGLQISNRLISQEIELSRQSSNAQNDINANNVQSAQFSSITENLERASVLSIQAANPLGGTDAIQQELNQIADEVNAVAGRALGDDNFLSGLDASDPTATQAAIDSASEVVNQLATANGADTNGLSRQVSIYETSRVNVSRARSGIQDTDFAQATSEQQQVNTQLQVAIINKRDEEARKGLLIDQLL